MPQSSPRTLRFPNVPCLNMPHWYHPCLFIHLQLLPGAWYSSRYEHFPPHKTVIWALRESRDFAKGRKGSKTQLNTTLSAWILLSTFQPFWYGSCKKMGPFLSTQKWHFECPNKNYETTFINPTSPKNDGIAFCVYHFLLGFKPIF